MSVFPLGSMPTGSSPLARGLPGGLGEHHADGRIIPARAGFTSGAAPRCRRRGDHPRSRGVYARCRLTPWASSGSSPLARGLQAFRRFEVPRPGIIPARAGFTSRASNSVNAGRGSSPLARGLPDRRQDRGHVGGIIPARAGFTACNRSRIEWSWDHPRSRGVYRLACFESHGQSGSSPLARGLPEDHGRRPARRGIIPARAGFTTTKDFFVVADKDHPRSRGVYLPVPLVPALTSGSSPLARGLLGMLGKTSWWTGIIPARAGFTNYHRFLYCDTEDHPRSRGVYTSIWT